MTSLFGISLALAVGGMSLVAFERGAGGAALGIGLTLAGVLGCATYTVIARRLMVDTSTLTSLIVQQLAALSLRWQCLESSVSCQAHRSPTTCLRELGLAQLFPGSFTTRSALGST